MTKLQALATATATATSDYRNSNSVDNKQILLLGTHTLQTKMLCTTISEQLSLRCKIVAHHRLNTPGLFNPNKDLLVIDCHQIETDKVLELLQRLQEEFPPSRVGLFNIRADAQYEELAEWPQVKGLFYDDCNDRQLLQGLKKLLNHELWLPIDTMQKLIEALRRPPKTQILVNKLTRREQQILAQLSSGATNQEIANHLHVSEHTIKSHLYNIFKKIGVKNRLLACSWGQKNVL